MQVIQMRRPRLPAREAELKRLALQLAAQLPEDTQEALDALDYTRTLVRAFLGDLEPL
jgi:flagellar biosynthesis regulator FlaF